MLTLEGPPPELVNRTLRSAMTTTSLCSNSNNVLSKKEKNRILSRSVWGRTSNDIKKPDPPFNQTVTRMTWHLTLKVHREWDQRNRGGKWCSWWPNVWEAWSTAIKMGEGHVITSGVNMLSMTHYLCLRVRPESNAKTYLSLWNCFPRREWFLEENQNHCTPTQEQKTDVFSIHNRINSYFNRRRKG